ncbi:MAG: hypothetical protein KF862_26465 [Chitinophagaceae bacterium]|nr:hypothetical protein [Chitinophagaceae bacterium]
MIHCSSKAEAEQLLEKLKERMQEYELELHPEKTKIVYCRNYQRKEEYENISFDFLSYSFQPGKMRDKFGRGNKTFMVYSPAMSNKALERINQPAYSSSTRSTPADIFLILQSYAF